MGNEKTKPVKPLSRLDLEIAAEKVVQHLTLARERKINELASKERELKDRLKRQMLPYEDICFELITIVNLFKLVKAMKVVVRYSQLIKEHSAQIVDACQKGDFAALRELLPYFEGVIWTADRLNLGYVKEFSALLSNNFGPEAVRAIKDSRFVDEELRQCFATIEPSPAELNDYLRGFCDRYRINAPVPRPPEPRRAEGQPGGYALPPLGQPAAAARPEVLAVQPLPAGDEFDDLIEQIRSPSAPEAALNNRVSTPTLGDAPQVVKEVMRWTNLEIAEKALPDTHARGTAARTGGFSFDERIRVLREAQV